MTQLLPMVSVKVSGAKSFFFDSKVAGAHHLRMWPNFKNHYLAKREEDIPDAWLSIQELAAPKLADDSIQDILGNGTQTNLVYILSLLKLHLQGVETGLRDDGWANLFYVFDKNEEVQVVPLSFNTEKKYWSADAVSISLDRPWFPGNRVCSVIR